MDYDKLWAIADHARAGRRLDRDDAIFIREEAPAALKAFPRHSLPTAIRHPAGFSVSGAPVGTFVNSALLLAAQKVFGRRYKGSSFYEAVETDFAFDIMRSHFHRGFPKGVHCCVQCTLAVYPVLAANGVRYFDGLALAQEVRQLIEGGGWRFAKPVNAAMRCWSLGEAASS